MADMTLNWTPGGTSNSTGQRVLRIAKPLGTAPNLNAVFVPSNDMSTTQSTAQATGLLTNIIYRFKVQNLCTVNGPTDNSNGVQEQIIFECVPISLTISRTGGIYAQVNLGIHSVIDGQTVTSESGSSIEAVEFSLYNAANTTLIDGPHLGTVIPGFVPRIFYEFTSGLSVATTYTVRYVFITTVNGVQVRSDASGQINAACTQQISIPEVPTTGGFTASNDIFTGNNNIQSVVNFGTYYTVASGTFPITRTSSNIVGTHDFVKGQLSVIVEEIDDGASTLQLKVNGTAVESISVEPLVTKAYTFAPVDFNAADDIEITLVDV